MPRMNQAPDGSLTTSLDDQELARSLQRIDELFDLVEQIADQGAAQFFDPDTLLRQAAVGTLIQLGEAVKTLPTSYRRARASVNYQGMIRLRDKLAHLPGDVDWGLVWTVISERIPDDCDSHRRALSAS